MATTPSNLDSKIEAATSAPVTRSLLISLSSLPPEGLEAMLTHLALAFPESPTRENVLVASPDAGHPILGSTAFGSLRLLPYTAVAPSINTLTLTVADYQNTFKMMQDHQAAACLVLGPASQSLSPEAIRALGSSSAQRRRRSCGSALSPRPTRRPGQLRHPLSGHPCSLRSTHTLSRSPSTSACRHAWPSDSAP